MPKKIALIIFIGIAMFFILKHGTSLYMPLVQKIRGKETVESISTKIENDVFNRIKGELKSIGLKDFPNHIINSSYRF